MIYMSMCWGEGGGGLQRSYTRRALHTASRQGWACRWRRASAGTRWLTLKCRGWTCEVGAGADRGWPYSAECTQRPGWQGGTVGPSLQSVLDTAGHTTLPGHTPRTHSPPVRHSVTDVNGDNNQQQDRPHLTSHLTLEQSRPGPAGQTSPCWSVLTCDNNDKHFQIYTENISFENALEAGDDVCHW